MRRVSITNAGSEAREIELTSYAELVLAPQADDVAHPAFSKMFVETEYLADHRHDPGDAAAARARASRRSGPRISPIVDGEAVGKPQVETDRARFLGRGHDVHRPIAVIDGRAAVQHRRHRARSRLRAAPPRADRARRDRAHRLLDGGRRVARRRARPGRQASRHHRVRARGHAGLDPGAGAAAPSRHRSGRGGPVPAPGRPPAVCRAGAAAVVGHDPSAAAAGSPGCGRTASPATCRSCCCASTTSSTSTSRGNCCGRTNTGG